MLGLADDYYDDDYEDDYYDEDEVVDDGEYDEPPSRSVYRSPFGEAGSGVRRVEREPDMDRAHAAVGPQVKMHIVEPRSYGEAQNIADRFKQGTPVIMNLTMSDPDLSKRLIDFASGLTYGLDGGLQKVSDKVFMLTPANVDVSDAQRRDLRAQGLFTMDR
jgi:cell division inhibitor SepF